MSCCCQTDSYRTPCTKATTATCVLCGGTLVLSGLAMTEAHRFVEHIPRILDPILNISPYIKYTLIGVGVLFTLYGLNKFRYVRYKVPQTEPYEGPSQKEIKAIGKLLKNRKLKGKIYFDRTKRRLTIQKPKNHLTILPVVVEGKFNYCIKPPRHMTQGSGRMVHQIIPGKGEMQLVRTKEFNAINSHEINCLTKLKDSPHVVTLVHQEKKHLYFELCNGKSLDFWVEKTPTLDAIRDVMVGALRGLHALHTVCSTLHLDLHWGNIFIHDNNGILGDLGSACPISDINPQKMKEDFLSNPPKWGMNSFLFPPELLKVLYNARFTSGQCTLPKVTPTVDIYACGMLLVNVFSSLGIFNPTQISLFEKKYTSFTNWNRRPEDLDQTQLQNLILQLENPIAKPASIPNLALHTLIWEMTHPDPSKRPQTAEEVADRLAKIQLIPALQPNDFSSFKPILMPHLKLGAASTLYEQWKECQPPTARLHVFADYLEGIATLEMYGLFHLAPGKGTLYVEKGEGIVDSYHTCQLKDFKESMWKKPNKPFDKHVTHKTTVWAVGTEMATEFSSETGLFPLFQRMIAPKSEERPTAREACKELREYLTQKSQQGPKKPSKEEQV